MVAIFIGFCRGINVRYSSFSFSTSVYNYDINTNNLSLKCIVVIIAGSRVGSGRYILILYTPLISNKYIKKSKNEDVQFLATKMKENIWKGQLIVLVYSLLPLPTTPLFLAAGMSKLNAKYIIPAFLIGKFTSDTLALRAGEYASENAHNIIQNALSWESVASLLFCLLLIFCILFIDWRSLIQKKKLVWKFKIFK